LNLCTSCRNYVYFPMSSCVLPKVQHQYFLPSSDILPVVSVCTPWNRSSALLKKLICTSCSQQIIFIIFLAHSCGICTTKTEYLYFLQSLFVFPLTWFYHFCGTSRESCTLRNWTFVLPDIIAYTSCSHRLYFPLDNLSFFSTSRGSCTFENWILVLLVVTVCTSQN
jgi:hypothetical protein